ncbi:predicted protein [Sclerotinia sclerotiorum 1980 UF-70]|uniref:Uncharacterized protein n=1 Tax=Sclerotinia sclerotiorum (strain ATCC 18683 / 1980 / Ss-1) TaxID=665079 RepID=A7ERI2_SCLS1|nr:predicted protein [Sclerotinia sclerotiorum 1980 UF-70]EDN92074.1 predicted protein [Sclerotinia sclerotiorum 1980 UF-70]
MREAQAGLSEVVSKLMGDDASSEGVGMKLKEEQKKVDADVDRSHRSRG